MINLDKLGEIKLERISPALNRKKWDLPLQYDGEYLGGFYDDPTIGGDEPVGIGMNFGSKTGDKSPVTLDLSCTKGVLLPGARYYTYEFCKPAAQRANELCRLLGLPPLIGELASDPYNTWQTAFPNDQCHLFRNDKGFEIVIEAQDMLLSVAITQVPPLAGPRYISATLYDLKSVVKNCPKREKAEILNYLRKPGERLPGKSLLDVTDFAVEQSSKRWTWRFPVSNPLGPFQLVIPDVANDKCLAAAMELLLSAERNYDLIQELVYGDYRRHETNNPQALIRAQVPLELKRKAMRDVVSERILIIQPITKAKGQSYTAIARVRPKWRGGEQLDFCFEEGRIVSVDGKPFELNDQVLWCKGDKKLKPKPPGTASAEQLAMASVIRMMPFEIEKGKAPRPLSSNLKTLMTSAKDAGFIHLGWLEVTMPLPVTIAAFANIDGGIMLSINTGFLMETESVDLVSHLDKNRKLTTTTFEVVMPRPERGIFKFSHAKATISQLLKKHGEHLRELNGTIQLRVKTLDEFAQAVRIDMKQENQP